MHRTTTGARPLSPTYRCQVAAAAAVVAAAAAGLGQSLTPWAAAPLSGGL